MDQIFDKHRTRLSGRVREVSDYLLVEENKSKDAKWLETLLPSERLTLYRLFTRAAELAPQIEPENGKPLDQHTELVEGAKKIPVAQGSNGRHYGRHRHSIKITKLQPPTASAF